MKGFALLRWIELVPAALAPTGPSAGKLAHVFDAVTTGDRSHGYLRGRTNRSGRASLSRAPPTLVTLCTGIGFMPCAIVGSLPPMALVSRTRPWWTLDDCRKGSTFLDSLYGGCARFYMLKSPRNRLDTYDGATAALQARPARLYRQKGCQDNLVANPAASEWGTRAVQMGRLGAWLGEWKP